MQKAKSLARTDDGPGTLWVVINSDEQAAKKKGKEFMPANERLKLVRALRFVDACIIAPDADHTVCKAIAAIHPDVFAIGLDEGQEYMKEEKELCKQMGIQVFLTRHARIILLIIAINKQKKNTKKQVVCPLGVRVQSSTFLLNKLKEDEEIKKRKLEEAAKNSSPEKKQKA